VRLEIRRSGPDAPGQRAGRRGSPSRTPYLIFALVVLALLTFQTLNRQWSTDYWMYTATIDALHEDLLDPVHDMTGSDDPSERFSPYTVALAATVRTSGFASVTVLQIAAIANLVLFLVAFKLFVTELTARRRVTFFALLATLVMWGLNPWRWSGYLNLNSIGFGMPWPSMFATGVGLLVAWALLRYDVTGARAWMIVVGLGVTLIALSHPYTFGWVSVMLLALVVHRRLYRRERVVPLLITALGAGALLAAWPYYPFFELGRAPDAYAAVMEVMYDDVPFRIVAALPGFVVVLGRLRRDRTDALALMLLGGLALYAFGAIADEPSFGRVLPLIMLSAHIGIGILVADLVERRRRATVPLVAWLTVSAAIGLVGAAPGLARTVPRALLPQSLRDEESLRPVTDQYDGLGNAIEPGSVVVAQANQGLSAIAPAFGIFVVAPGYPAAFVDDFEQRSRDAATFLDVNTTADTRREIADRYGVDGVLCHSAGCVTEFASGTVLARGSGWTLIRVAADELSSSGPT
jgi:hypothetical protein